MYIFLYIITHTYYIYSVDVCNIILVYNRLPVGHTHEDIDACFGTIAVWFDRNIIQTPQQYKEEIERAFAGSDCPTDELGKRLKIKVVDVFIVPDYKVNVFYNYICIRL